MVFLRGKKARDDLISLNEMATACHPKYKGGKYPMWIRVEYTQGEHTPPHAHLYSPGRKPSAKTLITKFELSDKPPAKRGDIQPMPRKSPVPPAYEDLIIAWAKDSTRRGTNNWDALWDAWDELEASL
jgi:hypothetical protein